MRNVGITTITELCCVTKSDLLRLEGFGAKKVEEIEDKLAELGKSLQSE